jgi:rhamnulose-1-phosphate aldolase/alcohol dehydrogenase
LKGRFLFKTFFMPSVEVQRFKYVSYLWDESKAAKLNSEIDLLLYRSNILGADLRITNYGGGNTSCKTVESDALTGEPKDVMWVKGSGGDIGTLTRQGLAGLYLDRLHSLKNRYRGLQFEDEMVGLLYHCLYDLDSKAPSIDTPLHAFLPFTHIDHLHPDALIALAASRDGEQIVKELYEGMVAWIPWQRPGFDLGLKLEKCVMENPAIKGIVLGGHGLFTWGETAFECYNSSLSVIERAAEFLEENYKRKPVFGGAKVPAVNGVSRIEKASAISPVLRGLCSTQRKMIGHFTDDPRVLEFINSHDADRLAALGTSCPDHFLRTKIRPLVIDIPADEPVSNSEQMKALLAPQFDKYRKYYHEYYEKHKQPNSPAIRDANPVVILWPGVGMFTYAKDKATARVSAEFYINAINVMKGAEAISSYVSLPLQEAFNIEYWQLEEDKLKRMPPDKPLTGRVALITGSAGGIGKAVAEKFIKEGAVVVICDNDQLRLQEAEANLKKNYKADQYITTLIDVTLKETIQQAVAKINVAFGGVDIVVNNAGISISRGFTEHTEEEWDALYDILVKGQFLVSQACVRVMKAQGIGGDIINIASKNGLVSGPKNAGYGSAKAAQLHMTRLMAAELGEYKIRVNAVNPDAIIAESKIWQSGWAKDRAAAYGVPPEELPRFYADRTLLKEILYPSDVANAVFAFVSGMLNKSTGNMLNVDGGLAPSFPR